MKTEYMAPGIRPEAVKAWVELTYALRDLEPVCTTDPDAWMADDAATRAEAATACRLSICPVIALCDRFAVANNETWGVWAGIDRDRRKAGAA